MVLNLDNLRTDIVLSDAEQKNELQFNERDWDGIVNGLKPTANVPHMYVTFRLWDDKGVTTVESAKFKDVLIIDFRKSVDPYGIICKSQVTIDSLEVVEFKKAIADIFVVKNNVWSMVDHLSFCNQAVLYCLYKAVWKQIGVLIRMNCTGCRNNSPYSHNDCLLTTVEQAKKYFDHALRLVTMFSLTGAFKRMCTKFTLQKEIVEGAFYAFTHTEKHFLRKVIECETPPHGPLFVEIENIFAEKLGIDEVDI